MKNSCLAFLLFLIIGCNSTDKKKNEEVNKKNIKTTELSDLSGKKVSIEDFKGQKILLNFWATWCGPCKKEMPDLLKTQAILAKENYVILLVSNESIEKISAFKQQSKYEFNYLVSNTSMSSLGVYALPTTYIYNEKGEKVDQIIGAVKWDSDEMITKLKEIK